MACADARERLGGCRATKMSMKRKDPKTIAAKRHIVDGCCYHYVHNPVYVSRSSWKANRGSYHLDPACPNIFGKGHAGHYSVAKYCAEERHLRPCRRCSGSTQYA